MQTELIVYACPVGPLADQIERYYAAARATCGPNAAHDYMAHITLTGFFRDAPDTAPLYAAALRRALAAEGAARPAQPLRITELRLDPTFHGLLIGAPWLEALAARFAELAGESPTRTGAIRLKRNLHLSLAYGFPPEQHAGLAQLAASMVSPQAAAGWRLRLYERAAARWGLHADLPLG